MMSESAEHADPARRPEIPPRHALRDQEALWAEVIKMGAVVADAVALCVRALGDGRAELAGDVKHWEQIIDSWEVRIEHECLRILALYEPVASDLRRLDAILRINADLERISDLARNIASRIAKVTADPDPAPIPPRLADLGREVLGVIQDCLDALARSDASLARAVIAGDNRIDLHYHHVLDELKVEIRRDPDRIDLWLRLIATARNLERMADHATQIAETIVFMKEGQIIRHLGTQAGQP
jgi:phosphate transport system protein